jgi:ribosomal protein S18 acetylase RimI-like enzyme
MILEIDRDNNAHLDLLYDFINSLGSSDQSFRYFSSRPITAINNHLCTVLLLENNQAVGYAHLDKEEENIWFGIAIAEGHTGKGLGDKLIRYVLEKSEELKIYELKLSVDETNHHAINLYEKHRFHLFKKSNSKLFFNRKSRVNESI